MAIMDASGVDEIRKRRAVVAKRRKGLTPEKARKMLHEGKAQGHRLTASPTVSAGTSAR